MNYYAEHGRDLPWRNKDLDLYHIIVTEILLKRTNSEKVAHYWKNFFLSYPDITSIYQTSERELEEVLQPLGLHHQRAAHLKNIANIVIKDFQGKLPPIGDLIDFPGIGQYAQSATALMAGQLVDIPKDVNFERIFSRLEFKGKFRDKENIIEFLSGNNQREKLLGTLDLAAQVCKPSNPKCKNCPLLDCCDFPKKYFEFEFHYTFITHSAQIISLSSGEYKLLKSNRKIHIIQKVHKKLLKKTYVYVRKPVSAIIGLGDFNFNNNCLKLQELYLPVIQLSQIRNLTIKFVIRSPFTWIYPISDFQSLISKVFLEEGGEHNF